MSARKGWEGAIRVGTTIADCEGSGSDEPAVQSVNPSQGNNVEELFEIGSRVAQELKEGNINLSVDITIHYQSDTTWTTRAGVGATGALTEYYLALYPAGASAPNPEIRLLGKFSDWSLDYTQDGVAVESVTFIARDIDVGAAWIG
jgi:maltoporin